MNARALVEEQSVQKILARAKAGETFEVPFPVKGRYDYLKQDICKTRAYHLSKMLAVKSIPNFVRLQIRKYVEGFSNMEIPNGYVVFVNQENLRTKKDDNPSSPKNVLKRALTGEKFDVSIMTKKWESGYGSSQIQGDQGIRELLRKYKIPHYRTSVPAGGGYITTVHVNQIKPDVRQKVEPRPLIRGMAKSTLSGAKKPYHIQSLDQQLPAPPPNEGT